LPKSYELLLIKAANFLEKHFPRSPLIWLSIGLKKKEYLKYDSFNLKFIGFKKIKILPRAVQIFRIPAMQFLSPGLNQSIPSTSAEFNEFRWSFGVFLGTIGNRNFSYIVFVTDGIFPIFNLLLTSIQNGLIRFIFRWRFGGIVGRSART
jgi:hypothetical protein